MWKRNNSNPKNTLFLNPTLTPSFTSPPPPPPSPSPVKKKVKSIQMVLCMYLNKTEY